jgi:hypothetical protein
MTRQQNPPAAGQRSAARVSPGESTRMSIFASRTIETIPLHADGVEYEVVIQKLAGRHLGRAQQAFLNEIIRGITERGGAKVQKDIQQLFEKDPEEAKKGIAAVKADPLNGYDKHALVTYGVKSWTYPVDIPGDFESKRSLFDDLEEEILDTLARAVLKLTKPSLFVSEDEAEAATKNV